MGIGNSTKNTTENNTDTKYEDIDIKNVQNILDQYQESKTERDELNLLHNLFRYQPIINDKFSDQIMDSGDFKLQIILRKNGVSNSDVIQLMKKVMCSHLGVSSRRDILWLCFLSITKNLPLSADDFKEYKSISFGDYSFIENKYFYFVLLHKGNHMEQSKKYVKDIAMLQSLKYLQDCSYDQIEKITEPHTFAYLLSGQRFIDYSERFDSELKNISCSHDINWKKDTLSVDNSYIGDHFSILKAMYFHSMVVRRNNFVETLINKIATYEPTIERQKFIEKLISCYYTPQEHLIPYIKIDDFMSKGPKRPL